LQIKTDRRETFLDSLAADLRKSRVPPFKIQFGKLKWVPNFERNRWFLVLGIEKPLGDELNRLLHACNKATADCGHPGLYTGERGDGPMNQEDLARSAKRRRTSNGMKAFESALCGTDGQIDRTEIFHISIAWNLIEPAPAWVDLVRNFDVSKLVEPPQTTFDAVKARIGNVVHNIRLASRDH
jgi:U6 snRNA phosphodiesterase